MSVKHCDTIDKAYIIHNVKRQLFEGCELERSKRLFYFLKIWGRSPRELRVTHFRSSRRAKWRAPKSRAPKSCTVYRWFQTVSDLYPIRFRFRSLDPSIPSFSKLVQWSKLSIKDIESKEKGTWCKVRFCLWSCCSHQVNFKKASLYNALLNRMMCWNSCIAHCIAVFAFMSSILHRRNLLIHWHCSTFRLKSRWRSLWSLLWRIRSAESRNLSCHVCPHIVTDFRRTLGK